MKKFLLLGVLVALVAAALAVPALAQRVDVGPRFDDCFPFCDKQKFFDFFNNKAGAAEPVVNQEIGQEAQSGDLSIQGSVSQRGDYSMQCVAPLQFGNTGNLQNAQGFVQSNSNAEDIEFGGSTFEFSPAVGVRCDQAVQQSAVASSH